VELSQSQQFKTKETKMSDFFNGKAFRVTLQDSLAIVDFDLQGERINKWSEASQRAR
jgi:hypothetical protein